MKKLFTLPSLHAVTLGVCGLLCLLGAALTGWGVLLVETPDALDAGLGCMMLGIMLIALAIAIVWFAQTCELDVLHNRRQCDLQVKLAQVELDAQLQEALEPI